MSRPGPASGHDLEELAARFPADFVWGAATASYQIEGAAGEDGRGPSIWDGFSHTPGRVVGGHNGDVACDHYHRYPDDVALMADLGIRDYRFSIAWPRVLPEGRGRVETRGLDFYRRLVDALLDAGIRPWATLYHWDLPQPLEDEGGWPVRSTAEAYVEYVDVVTAALGDRVDRWMTLNEPWCSSELGYRQGIHAPGRTDRALSMAATHHLLLGHGWAVPVIRANSPGSTVGIVLNPLHVEPASDHPDDMAAAAVGDALGLRWYCDPLVGRGYPADGVAHFGRPMDFVHDGDLDAMAVPVDFLGVNYYTRTVAGSDERRTLPRLPQTDYGWEVYPDGLRDLLVRLGRDYPEFPSIVVTESGCAWPEPEVSPADGLDDVDRVDYMRRYVMATAEAVEAGAPVAGYFVWSFLDNFEWNEGYTKRFGIVHVDYDTQSRTPKASYRWYQDLLRVIDAARSQES